MTGEVDFQGIPEAIFIGKAIVIVEYNWTMFERSIEFFIIFMFSYIYEDKHKDFLCRKIYM